MLKIATLFLLSSFVFASDPVFKDVVINEVSSYKETVLGNRATLITLESDLKDSVDKGLVEKEACIRKGIASLRAIDLVYNWVLEQLDSMNYDNIDNLMMQNMDRVRKINKLFLDISYGINDCYLVNTDLSSSRVNTMTKHNVGRASKIMKYNINIKEEFKAARVPFR